MSGLFQRVASITHFIIIRQTLPSASSSVPSGQTLLWSLMHSQPASMQQCWSDGMLACVCVCDGRLVWWRRCNETSCHQSSRRDSAQTPVRPAWWHRRATRQLNETASVTTFPVAAASPGTGWLRQMLWFIALGMHGLRAFTAVPSSTRALTLFGTLKWVSAYGLSYNKSCDGGCGR